MPSRTSARAARRVVAAVRALPPPGGGERCRGRARSTAPSAQPATGPATSAIASAAPSAARVRRRAAASMRLVHVGDVGRRAARGSLAGAGGRRGAVRGRRSWFDHLSEGGEPSVDQGCDRAGPAAEGVGDVGVGQAAVEAEDQRGALAVGERGEGVGQLAGAELGGFARAQVEAPEPAQPAVVRVAGVDDAAPEVGAVVRRPAPTSGGAARSSPARGRRRPRATRPAGPRAAPAPAAPAGTGRRRSAPRRIRRRWGASDGSSSTTIAFTTRPDAREHRNLAPG